MRIDEDIVCPRCNGTYFSVKREATYVYTYHLDTPVTEARSGEEEGLPFLFDSREQTYSKEYLECEQCGACYPCDIDRERDNIQFTILRKAIRADNVDNPEFLG